LWICSFVTSSYEIPRNRVSVWFNLSILSYEYNWCAFLGVFHGIDTCIVLGKIMVILGPDSFENQSASSKYLEFGT